VINWSEHVAESKCLFKSELEALTDKQLNLKPSENLWSIAEVLSHIITLNLKFKPSLYSVIEQRHQNPLASLIPGATKWFGQVLIKACRPGANPTRTVSIFRPVNTIQINQSIVKDFIDNLSWMENVLEQLPAYYGSGIILKSPAFGLLTYKLEDAVEIISLHIRKHLEQVQGLKEQLISELKTS
jgi:hypothetical protein